MTTATQLPARNEVAASDTWDLSSLYESPEAWESDFAKFKELSGGFEAFRGTLAQSASRLAEALTFDSKVDRLAERLGSFAFLKTTEDQANDDFQAMQNRFRNVAVGAAQAASFFRPEILAIPTEAMDKMLADPALKPFKLGLERMLRFRPHTLTDREERLLAMQGEMSAAASTAFRQLNDADLKFGNITDPEGNTVELTNATFSQFLIHPDRETRRQAFDQYYAQFKAHENTLAATLAGSIHRDVYYAKVRNYSSSLEAALFPDNVPTTVYDNLISAVRDSLPAVHHYLDVRKRKMGIDKVHHYDTYVPILSDIKKHHTWDQAVETILTARTAWFGVLGCFGRGPSRSLVRPVSESR